MEQDRKAKVPEPDEDSALAAAEKRTPHNRMPQHRNPSIPRQQRRQPRPMPAAVAESVAVWARAVEPDAASVTDKAVDVDVAPVAAVADAAWAADAGLVVADVAGVDFLPLDGYAYDES